MAKPMHTTKQLAARGAVDADGHILEPPDLWETYLEPKYRDRALRIVADENGLEELEIGGERSRMSKRGFPSTLGAMGAAMNFAFANRQVITHRVREVLRAAFGEGVRAEVVYDVCHNVAKKERHEVDGVERELVVHRKGATRAFGPGNPALPAAYRELGQPVLVPGDMGRTSYVLLGTAEAERRTFGSCCHGAGRRM